MMTCQSCTEQLLEYVYGLFDANDAADAQTLKELRAHLETCPTCQAAYERARKQQKVLAQASRVKTEVTFTAPKVEPRRSTILRLQSSYTSWYVTAASLLVAFLAVTGSAYWWGKSTRWQAVEEARLNLEAVQAKPAQDIKPVGDLKDQLAGQVSTTEHLKRTLKELEASVEKQLLASTNYQQVLAPTMVEANNDAPIVVTNNTLTDQPAPINELAYKVTDTTTQNSMTQQYRRSGPNSNKYLYAVPSLAFDNASKKTLKNEISQDAADKVLGYKINHPIQVLQAELAAHLCTDKPLYQPGEKVYFRGLALDKTNFTPIREELEFTFTLTGPGMSDKPIQQWKKTAHLIDPTTGKPIQDIRGQTLQAIGCEAIELPKSMPLGECQLTLTEKNDRFPAQTVKFMVNTLTAPQFDKQLQFTRASYAPGDDVLLTGKIKLPSQKPWTNGAIKAEIQIDGEKYDAKGNKTQNDIATSTDAAGNLSLAFSLPKSIQQGQGTVSLKMLGSEGSETWSHPLRIETGSVQIDCFPEGGDIIAGTSNYLYFQMRNKNGEAVDGEVELLDSKQQPILTASTFSDETEAKASRGMGTFRFTPKAQESYSLRTRKPATTSDKTALPLAKASGVAMHVEKSVMPAGTPLQLSLSNMGKPRELAVSVYCREVLIALDRLSMTANTTQTILIEAIKPLGGVYRVTVAEIVQQNNGWQLTPLAERLVYRQPSKQLQLNLRADSAAGKPLKLGIDARNENNQPSPAYLTIVGVNQSLLQLAESTTNRRMPAHFLIASEVRQPEELEFADFFLSPHPSAVKALDLLLGVQGWRRFKEADSPAVLDQLAKKDALPIRFYDNREQMVEMVQRQVKERVEQSTERKQLFDAEKSLNDLQQQSEMQEGRQTNDQVNRGLQLARAESQLNQSQEQWRLFLVWFYLGSAAVLGVLSLFGIIMILARRTTLPVNLRGTLGTLSLLGLLGTAYLWYQQPSPEAERRAMGRAEPAAIVRDAKDGASELREPAPAKSIAKTEAPPSRAREGAAVNPPPASDAMLSKQAEEIRKQMPRPAKSDDAKDVPMNAKESLKRKEPGEVHPPAPAMAAASQPSPPGGKLNVPGNAYSQRSNRDLTQTNKGGAKDQMNAPRQVEQQNVNKLADNRVRVIPSINQPMQFGSDKAAGKQLSKGDMEKEKVSPQLPSPATSSMRPPTDTGRPGGGAMALGSGAVGGMGGGGGGKAPGFPDPRKTEAGSMGEGNRQQNGFLVREYSWRADAKPAAITQSSAAWSKTVYWRPLEIVPSNGKLELPIELPPNEGVYHFDVFGHDGEGRLGTASIDIPAPVQPVSLQTKLSKTQAKVGDVVQLECQVQNLSIRRQPQVIAKVQLPEGTHLPPSLRQLRSAAKTAASEDSTEPTRWYVQDRELTLIWADLAAGQRVKLSIDLICSKPGNGTTATSKAYLENQEADAAVASGLSLKVIK